MYILSNNTLLAGEDSYDVKAASTSSPETLTDVASVG